MKVPRATFTVIVYRTDRQDTREEFSTLDAAVEYYKKVCDEKNIRQVYLSVHYFRPVN